MSGTIAVPSRGRPRLSGSVRQIRLRSSVFELWNLRKYNLGFKGATNSEFAEFLLHLPMEGTLRSPRVMDADKHLHGNLSNPDYPPLSSTPVVTSKRSSTPFALAKRRRIELDNSSSAFGESSLVEINAEAMRRLSRSLLLHVVVLMLFIEEAHQCSDVEPQESMNGWMLQRHIYRTMMADIGLQCLYDCHKDDRCQSFNYVFSLRMCEFSNRTKEARPEDFVPDPDRYYFRRDKRRVALGSIPELAAESCKEIKASEKDPVSGKYWLSTIKPGMSVFAHCDMKTGDIDECSASQSVCDINATCHNNQGSYLCSCKAGFTGDGKNCTAVPWECHSYTLKNETDRSVTAGSGNKLDTGLTTGWYRFNSTAGSKMPTYCVETYRCSAHATGWLNGAHPTPQEGIVNRTVCFHWAGNCCWWQEKINVRNCGSFYVYKLVKTPGGTFRYCVTE